MADTQTPKSTVTEDQAVDFFIQKLQEPGEKGAHQRELFYGLKEKYPNGISRKDLAGEIAKDPAFSEVAQIGDPDAPPSQSGVGSPSDIPTLGKAIMSPMEGVFGHPVSTYLQGKESKLTSPAGKFAGQVAVEAARAVENLASPLSMATLGLGGVEAAVGREAMESLVPSSISSPVAKAGKWVRGTFTAGQGINSIDAAKNFISDKSPENLAKLMTSLGITGASAYGTKKFSKGITTRTSEEPPLSTVEGSKAAPSSSDVIDAEFVDMPGPRRPPKSWKPSETREIPAATESKVTDSVGARMAQQPPSPVNYPKDYPDVKLVGGSRVGQPAIESGPSGYVPDPRAQSRIGAPEANRIATQFGVPPSKLVELSGLPDKDLVSLANQLTASKRALMADPSEFIKQPSGGEIRKDILVDQLTRWSDAISHMQLYRGQPPPAQ